MSPSADKTETWILEPGAGTTASHWIRSQEVAGPISGEIVEVNEELADEPEIINSSPYDNGWLFKIRPSAEELDDLMDADAYLAEIAE